MMKWPGDIKEENWYRLQDNLDTYAEIWVGSGYYPNGMAYIYMNPKSPARGMIIQIQYDSVEEGIADLEKTCREMWEV